MKPLICTLLTGLLCLLSVSDVRADNEGDGYTFDFDSFFGTSYVSSPTFHESGGTDFTFTLSYELGQAPLLSISMDSARKAFFLLREQASDYTYLYFTLSNGEIIQARNLMGSISATLNDDGETVCVSATFQVDKCQSDSSAAHPDAAYFLQRFSRYDIRQISIMKSPSEGFNFGIETSSAAVITRMCDLLKENIEVRPSDGFGE